MIEGKWEDATVHMNVRMNTPPPVVGSMEILPNVFLNLTRKPHGFHRFMTRWLLGWKWADK